MHRACISGLEGTPSSPRPSCQAKLTWVQNCAVSFRDNCLLPQPETAQRRIVVIRVRKIHSALLPVQVRLGAPPKKCLQELFLILRLESPLQLLNLVLKLDINDHVIRLPCSAPIRLELPRNNLFGILLGELIHFLLGVNQILLNFAQLGFLLFQLRPSLINPLLSLEFLLTEIPQYTGLSFESFCQHCIGVIRLGCVGAGRWPKHLLERLHGSLKLFCLVPANFADCIQDFKQQGSVTVREL